MEITPNGSTVKPLLITTSVLQRPVSNDHHESRRSNFSTKTTSEVQPPVYNNLRLPKSGPKYHKNMSTASTFVNLEHYYENLDYTYLCNPHFGGLQ